MISLHTLLTDLSDEPETMWMPSYENTLWTPLRVNNTNISGELPHSPGIMMNTG